MPKILVVTGDGGESYETLYAVHRFQEAGWEPVVAAPSRRRLHLVMHDFEQGWDTYVERQGYSLESDVTFDDVNPADYEAVLLVGGRAPEYLRNNAKLLGIVKDFAAADKWMFAICHGVQILATARIVQGRRVTCYEHVRSEMELAGATWLPAQAVRDGLLVTAQTWQSHPEFYRHVFECLSQSASVSPSAY